MGPVNLGNPEEVTILELARTVARAAGVAEPRIELRPRPVDDPEVRRPDITRAVTELGWKPRYRSRRGSSGPCPGSGGRWRLPAHDPDQEAGGQRHRGRDGPGGVLRRGQDAAARVEHVPVRQGAVPARVLPPAGHRRVRVRAAGVPADRGRGQEGDGGGPRAGAGLHRGQAARRPDPDRPRHRGRGDRAPHLPGDAQGDRRPPRRRRQDLPGHRGPQGAGRGDRGLPGHGRRAGHRGRAGRRHLHRPAGRAGAARAGQARRGHPAGRRAGVRPARGAAPTRTR